MPAVWSPALPQFVMAGYSETLPYPNTRRHVEIGPAVVHRRSSSAASLFRMEIELERDQAPGLLTFYHQDLRGGSDAFEWFDPLDEDVETFTFRAEPELREQTTMYWRASLQLEGAIPPAPAMPEGPASWGPDLPLTVLIGYQHKAPATSIRSDQGVGPTQIRQRGSYAPIPIEADVEFEREQAIAFRTWWREELLFGLRRFDWADPMTGDAAVLRFTAAVTLRHHADTYWRASLPLERLDVPALDVSP